MEKFLTNVHIDKIYILIHVLYGIPIFVR